MLKSPGSDALNGQDTRNTRLYLTGLTASLLGDSAMTLVAGIWVKSLTGSNSAAALVSVGIYAPSLLAPVAGVVADRVRRRRLVLASNLAMAAVMLTLLGVDRASRVWLIYAVMTCYGVALALIDPAENALFAIMLDDGARARLNGLRMSLQEGCKLVAPLAGAGLFLAIGGGWVAALDARRSASQQWQWRCCACTIRGRARPSSTGELSCRPVHGTPGRSASCAPSSAPRRSPCSFPASPSWRCTRWPTHCIARRHSSASSRACTGAARSSAGSPARG
jgi:hypothetical protein